ncbi:hypothetical protein TrVE_jg531 [Triparma verrucosa]|nr:hypothetical protein TrVE_jg531 [Triparma verrucosa]
MYGAIPTPQDDGYEINGKLFPEIVADALLNDEEDPLPADEQRRAYNRDARDRQAREKYFKKRRALISDQHRQQKNRHSTRVALATPLRASEYASACTCAIVVGLIVFGVIFSIALLMIRGGIREIEKVG